ncbi:class I tRNA ligase family protein [Eggerthellaceae bacterium zg-997]|nr:class I tRNA ligase family protein [Eggerthellaceae bacterium zg-997]
MTSLDNAASFTRAPWPTRAVVTAGMPYGNKPLHFGHIAGVFVPADAFARFLRDRIGPRNVRFVSGTDCYGSPINEGYRKLVEEGRFEGSIADYVMANHQRQRDTLRAYDVSLSVYEGSGIGHAGEVHRALSDAFIRRLHERGVLHRRSTLQFYDPEASTFLNGRQVLGRCPVQGCKSEHAYADECDLGHSYAPEDLIAPRSSLTGGVPEMRPVDNWYFDLPAFRDFLLQHAERLEADPLTRAIVPQALREFLADPIIYVKNENRAAFDELRDSLPPCTVVEAEKGKQSFEAVFRTIDERDRARDVMRAAGLRFRTGKALVPFRITGNIEWGVPAPTLEGVEGLTVWCWPESLWAPISFTIAACDAQGDAEGAWRDFWCDPDAAVYQFMGQDNLYFYGVVQPALFEALRDGDLLDLQAAPRPLRQTRLVANHHVLLGSKKASSSSAVKPPTADELLEHYTVEQLRAHFLALGLDQRSVGFKPKPFTASEAERSDPRVADPVLKEGALLTNVYNRIARSCLYELKKSFACRLPVLDPSDAAVAEAHAALASYDDLMHRTSLHGVMSLMDEFLRTVNKRWADGISQVEAQARAEDADEGAVRALRSQVLADAVYQLWVSTLLMHPVVPTGSELICEYLRFDPARFFSWSHEFRSIAELCDQDERDRGWHDVSELPPRFDFFRKHASQLK